MHGQVKADVVSDLLKASYKRNKEAEAIGLKNKFKLDHDLSNAEAKVFINAYNKPTVVFTGSRKVGDWVTDALIGVGLGKYTKRFSDTNKLIKEVKQKYHMPITTLGHSLGGRLAEYAGENNKAVKKVITLNKAAGLYDRNKAIHNKQTDIRGTTDLPSLLSLGQRTKNKITLNQTAYANPFKVHDINVLRKLKNKFI